MTPRARSGSSFGITVAALVTSLCLHPTPVSASYVIGPPTVAIPSDAPQVRPVVDSLADGGFVLIVEEGTVDFGIVTPPLQIDGRDGDVEGIVGRVFNADGTPRGPAFVVNEATHGSQICPRVAADPASGGFAVAWIDADRDGVALVRRFAANGEPQGGEILLADTSNAWCGLDLLIDDRGWMTIATHSVERLTLHRVEADDTVRLLDADDTRPKVFHVPTRLVPTADGGAILGTWPIQEQLNLDRIGPDGRLGASLTQSILGSSFDLTLRLADQPTAAELLVVFTNVDDQAEVQSFHPDFLFPGPATEVVGDGYWAAITTTPDQATILATTEPGRDDANGRLTLRRFAGGLVPDGSPIEAEVAAFSRFASPVSVVTNAASRVLVAWETGLTTPVEILLAETTSSALELRDGRFEARVTWRDPDGATGSGFAVPISTDTGAFWFFEPNNLELTVKVLDGRAINGHFWVFQGSMTNVEYRLTVTDIETGAVYTIDNPQGQFGSFGDIEALPGP